jgi:hypothetical protein
MLTQLITYSALLALLRSSCRVEASNALPLPTWEIVPATPDDSTPWGIIQGAGGQAYNHLTTKTLQVAMEPFIMVVEILEIVFNGDYATFGDKLDTIFKLFADRVAFFSLLHLRFIRGFLVIVYETVQKLLDLFFPGLAQDTFLRWKGYSQLTGGSGASPNVTQSLYHLLNTGYLPDLP